MPIKGKFIGTVRLTDSVIYGGVDPISGERICYHFPEVEVWSTGQYTAQIHKLTGHIRRAKEIPNKAVPYGEWVVGAPDYEE